MKIRSLLFAILAMFCITSCGTLTQSQPFTVSKKLYLTMQDFKFLGETEITCDYDTYFFLFDHINMVNDKVYTPGDVVEMNLPISGLNLPSRAVNMAAADLLEKYPEACYFQVVMQKEVKERLFLGSTSHVTARVRAYTFK